MSNQTNTIQAKSDESVKKFMDEVACKNPGQSDFYQAVHEVAQSVVPFIDNNPIYKNDKVRTENIDEAKIIEKNLLYIYKSFGFEPIIVPKEKIEKRVDFIISQCDI